MPSLEVWGPAVWTLFHTLAERVHENAYPFIANQLFDQIVRICKVLPCPDCSTDASYFLAKINISTFKTKTEFKNFVYLFHNYVNAKKRKPLFNVINLKMYNHYKLIPVVNNFLTQFNTNGNLNLINESFQRNLVKNNFKKWFIENIRAFTPPPNIQMSPNKVEEPVVTIKEIVVNEETIETAEENVVIETTEENVLIETALVNEEPIIEIQESEISNKEHIKEDSNKSSKNKKKNKK